MPWTILQFAALLLQFAQAKKREKGKANCAPLWLSGMFECGPLHLQERFDTWGVEVFLMETPLMIDNRRRAVKIISPAPPLSIIKGSLLAFWWRINISHRLGILSWLHLSKKSRLCFDFLNLVIPIFLVLLFILPCEFCNKSIWFAAVVCSHSI